ncbi:MAG: succinate dehydrogenase assembly factor 2 [Gammaproteobacteria bacterium]|nr:succinate dehydrogenase assembly factor 2 [Gammaproteobacteria bacterium]MBU1443599.1 succinate dehydrogenase assembly factor 2 [Gammaproteobacteria bacterium]MBU2289192.1 succinate dehydrogenase assembly factor 2 [Gammaproteobacteria bacterium]MBU2409677.1 succinate dehydrogenase assembly factor 2 [Gammaproteobacteria bacterium]
MEPAFGVARIFASPAAQGGEVLGERALSKLKWRCRRGLLENDLFIARFFERHESGLTCARAQAMETLMDLSDNDLLDLLLGRKEPEADWANPDVVELLRLMRQDGAHISSDRSNH